MNGYAVLTPKGEDTLVYVETGDMQLGQGPVLQATRTYIWRFVASEIVVTFADGADFHRFTPDGVVNGTDHPCGQDYYRVAYDFSVWPAWHATWDVSGPRKDYSSVSRYCR